MHHHAIRPGAVVGRLERAIDNASVQVRLHRPLVDEGDVDFLTETYPECRLPETGTDG